MKIGIFGGTFNPIHYGHLRSAEEAREALGLDQIVFVPCFLPPHKGHKDIAPPEQRLEMLKMAIADNTDFELSRIELNREGPSYSVETFRELRKTYGADKSLYFIIGADSFVEIGLWKNYEELFQLTNLIIVTRPGYMQELGNKSPTSLLPVAIQPRFCYDSTKKILHHDSGMYIHFLETTGFDIASTRVRKCVAERQSITYLLPPDVERYIEEKKLYRT